MPEIAVIVPTFNSGRTLGQCLDSILEQTQARNELIVVDRFSQDHSFDVAKARGATVLQSEATRSAARNIGFKHASSPAALFLDADMIAPPELLEQCSNALEQYDALVIPEVSVGVGFWSKCRSAERRTEMGNNLLEAARCFRREAFLSLGGYNELLEAGEDWDLQNRAKSMGLPIGKIRATITHDDGPLTLPRILAREYFYGQTFGRYIETNPRIAFKQINPVKRIIVPSLAIILKDTRIGIGVLVLRTLEFSAAGAGSIVGKRHRETPRRSAARE